MLKPDENLYFVVKPAEHLRSRYYLGNEDGVWPATLEQINGKWKPIKSSSIMIPYSWVQFHIAKVKPSGMRQTMQPVEDPLPKEFEEFFE